MTEPPQGLERLKDYFHMDWDLEFASQEEAITRFAQDEPAHASVAVASLTDMAERWSEKRIRKELRFIIGSEAADLPQPRWKNAALRLRDRIIAAQEAR
ncbi:contact-dependent growth inhibition system immunity protein [Allosalinactinospora lopnorensis]|uniref:contact-dependent growth inhibition system immunity protein n=1 Tax=Allosalinactinospora lopnorensis TaxID=1352348 RepID=UPI000623D5A3|nr:hypothetical protein [Allosalinactinospora lopnorensis]